jgi:hypothetical protein
MKRTLLLLVFTLTVVGVFAQRRGGAAPPSMRSKGTAQEKFLNKQFWLGFKAGINLTDPLSQAGYSVMVPTNYDAATTKKKYERFNKLGGQATLEVTFYYKGISISAQPTYRTSKFSYSNEYTWEGSPAAPTKLNMKFDQEQQLDYFDLPLLLKYEFTQNKLKPFIQAGIYYSILVNATKGVTVSGTDNASGGTTEFKNEPVIVGAKDLFTNNWGAIAGGGLNYNLGNVRVVLDVSYHIGMSNIANVKNRYGNDRLSGIGDAQDDLRTNHLLVSVGCLFPLRFLSNDFKSTN